MMRLEVRLGARGRWLVRQDGEFVAANDTQQYAIDLARALAQNEGGEVIWYDRYGQLQGTVDFSPFSWPSSGLSNHRRWDDEAASVGT